ncbi:DUF1289 domain-containing protein [Pseudomonas asuensis]|uniref:DUF1289 domain-containing protein n=1 Tax=Pseudomonas asuensis TaxID=1825787 RepID=A0ABQ2GT79_9PSED|nr:DUF1289 domain-containing protein [Pseudomonas asuensis]GGM09479.1 hypothetical protein GCM10009425_20960 [Pseudomonas asuensis]
MSSISASSNSTLPGEDAELVASPCVRRCCLSSQDICLGCGRTLDEILAWGEASAEERRAIILAAQARRDHRSATS